MVGSPGLNVLDLIGIAVWGIGFIIEVQADRELTRFLAAPEHVDKVCDRGLWRYSRHPNYFGETLLWVGIYLIAVASGPGVWALFSPLIVAVMFVHPTGYPRLERASRAKRPDYAAYAARTRAFLPWSPKT
jgi:steroid 5-alpha reductase family enzyme